MRPVAIIKNQYIRPEPPPVLVVFRKDNGRGLLFSTCEKGFTNRLSYGFLGVKRIVSLSNPEDVAGTHMLCTVIPGRYETGDLRGGGAGEMHHQMS